MSWCGIRLLQTVGLATSVHRASLPFKLPPANRSDALIAAPLTVKP